MNIVDMVRDELSGQVMSKLSSLIGENEAKTKTAVGAAIPAILAGLSHVASSASGAQKLASAMSNLDTGALGNAAAMFSGHPGSLLEQGSGLLNSVLGGNLLSGITNSLGKFSGLSGDASKKLLGYLMPLVLGMISKGLGGRAVSAQGLASMLADQKSNIANSLPAGFSLSDIPGLGSAGAAARQAVGAAQDVGTSAMRWLLPIAALAAIALVAWYYFSRQPAEAPLITQKPADAVQGAARVSRGAMEDAAGGVKNASKSVADAAKNALPAATQLGKELTNVYTSATESLGTIKDAASAEAAIPKLKDLSTKLDSMKTAWESLPAAGKSTISSITSTHLGKLKEMVEKVLAMAGVSDKIKPLLNDIVTKLSSLT